MSCFCSSATSFVLAVGGDDHAQFLRQSQRVEELGVVDAERAFVGEEDFERRDAALHDLPQLLFGRGVESRRRPCGT